MRTAFSFSFGPGPLSWAFADTYGFLRKTTKTKLAPQLEKRGCMSLGITLVMPLPYLMEWHRVWCGRR